MMNLLNTISQMDIFDLCDCLEDDSIDMILADVPYSITACEWDVLIPFEPMWECFKRIIKPRGAIVLTASGKFTYKLVMSNFEWFKYEWVWVKNYAHDFLLAKTRPRQIHEHILVFSKTTHFYYPIMERGESYRFGRRQGTHNIFGLKKDKPKTVNIGVRFPESVINKKNMCRGKQHPTQKPVALFEYLIRTYTQPGETVFDPCVGSGTTAIAARNTGRNYIVGDSSAEYVDVARKRLAAPYTVPMFEEVVTESKPEQLNMFSDNQ